MILSPRAVTNADPAAPESRPLADLLRQLAGVVATLTDEQYAAQPVGPVSSSIGRHVRHSLEHVEALLTGVRRRVVDYDRPDRGPATATNRRAALAAIRRLEAHLHALPARWLRRPLRLSALLTSSGPPAEFRTTFGRELAFVLSHAIHHNSLVAVALKYLGVPVPPNFGYAPATVARREKKLCVR